MSRPETGESTRAIHTRADDEAWPRALAALERGATLFRPVGLPNYYAFAGDDPVSGTALTKIRVAKLEASGVLRHAGVDRYALTAAAAAEEVA